MPAVAGVTTNFTLNTVTPTQIATSNSARAYAMLINLDTINGIWFGFGTNNTVAKNTAHWLGPRRYYEMPPGRIIQGDVSAIADAGTPIVSWVEE